MNVATDTPSVRNITRIFRAASAEEIVSGAAWYEDAHNIASALGVKYGYPVESMIGVIAALSPQNAWGNNVNLAARVIAGHGTITTGGLPKNIEKANAILLSNGADPLDILGGLRFARFTFLFLLRGTEGITVDRHAYDIAVNYKHTDDTRPSLTGKRYAAVAECYARAAVILSREYGTSFTAGQVQSVTWELWRKAHTVTAGAYDKHEAI